MDKSVLIQKTIRDNNEDLHNFMRDLNHWECDMKRKDAELTSEKESKELLPPVRSKRRKEKKASSQKSVEKETIIPKRISSFDYTSWEKFDVDKACEDVDKAGSKVISSSDSESDEESKLDRLRQQAIYEKGLGNECVKKERWKKAIEHYTKAIECYNKDAIFFANRALCYLKTKQFKTAEEDCTKSLELDSQYVKAYQRRAAARIALENFFEAQSDLNAVLKLEPNNAQAKKDLEKLKADQKISNKEVKISQKKTDATKNTLLSSQTSSKKVESETTILKNNIIDSCENIQEYPWGPVDETRIIKPIYKPPHLRSKKQLTRVEIKDIDNLVVNVAHHMNNANKLNLSKDKEMIVLNNNNEDSNSISQGANENATVSTIENRHKKEIQTLLCETEVPVENIEIPPPARTSVQFYQALKKLKNNRDFLYQYLISIDSKNFPSIFQDSLESDVFSCIIDILTTEFIKHGDSVSKYLVALTNIRRFEMLVLFMNKEDKEGVKKLLDYCVKNKEISNDGVLFLKKKFQLIR